MLCCVVGPSDPSSIQKTADFYRAKERDAFITGIALGMIALLLFAISCFLYGVGTLPPTELMGLGVLPYLGGAFLNFLSLGVSVGAIVFGVIATVRAHQN